MARCILGTLVVGQAVYAAQSHNLLRSVEMCHLKGQHSNVSNMFKELVLYVFYIFQCKFLRCAKQDV